MTTVDAQLLDQLADHYDLAFTGAQRLGGEVDMNVKVTDSTNRPWFLKATADLDHTREHWQWHVIDHVARVDADLPVPRIHRNRHGSLATRLIVDGVEVEAALMTWLPGQAMGRADGVDSRTRRDLGRRAAQLHRALQSMDAVGLPTTHHWDVRAFGTALDAPLAAVPDGPDRVAVRDIVERCGPVADRLADLPTAIVHQDLNDFNVLVAPRADGAVTVSGIIDFGDTLIGLRVGEVVVAAAYAMLRQEDPVSAFIDVVEGFSETQPLTQAEAAVVYPLAALRLCVNGCTWTQRTATQPSEYGLSRMAFTWPVIRALADVDPNDVEVALTRRIESVDDQHRPSTK